jgi:hypothetical protein
MFCFVDARNRPQYKYTFSTREKAREHLRKIQNNPMGATVIHADGRREYFENGLPAKFSGISKAKPGRRLKNENYSVLKGCHVKYKIRHLAVLDGVAGNERSKKNKNASNWKSRTASPLFMLGNLKFSACLLIVALSAFSFSYVFQKNFGRSSAAEEVKSSSGGLVLGATDDRSTDQSNQNDNMALQLADEDVIMSLIGKIDDERHEAFKDELMGYVKGHPMEDMAPYIAKQPRIVAAFIVGIAMKESKFGTYAPHLNGQDCHNYWGFKGGGTTTSGGYTCFNSPEEAIRVVGKRIAKLVDGGRTNPSEMVIWKCGASCSWDDPANVRKWIADVGVNFYRINNTKENS